MKVISAAALTLLAIIGCAPQSAHAVTSNSTTRLYYRGTQLVGQSLLPCNNLAEHWGDASPNLSDGSVYVRYACDGGGAQVTYPSGLNPAIVANFCNDTGLCDAPEAALAIGAAGPVFSGYYSE